MSKLARKPIAIPQGVEVKQNDGVLEFSGKEGKLTVKVLPFISVELSSGGGSASGGKDGQLTVKLQRATKQGRANWGTTASLVKNAIGGVNEGFRKNLEMEGVGFKASMEGNNLVLNVGFTHPVKYVPPTAIKIVIEKGVIKVSGSDKALVGETAAQIRKIYPPEPYKGKGIHYQGEVVRRKAGKKVAGTGAAA